MRTGLVVATGLLAQSSASAAGSVTGTSVDNGDGTFTYSYTVENIGGVFDIVGFALDFSFDAATRDWDPNDVAVGGDVVVADPFWFAQDGIPTTGLSAQDFLSLTPSSDVFVGSSLGVFSFLSSIAPGSVSYTIFGAQGESGIGTTVGPGGVVPEANSLLAASVLALGCGWVAARRRNRS